MTTNVFDSNVGLMTTDSRWSVTYGNYLVYVDDARFEKIERYKNAVFMFAGNGAKVQAWKSWIRSNPTSDVDQPDCDLMCVCIADQATNQVLFQERQDIVKDGGFFAGSGSIHAFRCWSANRDSRKAVETAKTFDFASGGEVKFLDFGTGDHNLFSASTDVHISDVSKAIATRGNVMEIAVNNEQKPPFKLSELAANDVGMQELQGRIASGEIAPTAPCDGMYSEWTDGQKTRLKGVLSDVFGW